MARQPQYNSPSVEKEKSGQHKKEMRNYDNPKIKEATMKDIDDNDNPMVDEGRVLDEKIRRNAFLKLDLDAIAMRMKKDLADRCCCADVPCVSIVKEYCESRY